MERRKSQIVNIKFHQMDYTPLRTRQERRRKKEDRGDGDFRSPLNYPIVVHLGSFQRKFEVQTPRLKSFYHYTRKKSPGNIEFHYNCVTQLKKENKK